MRSKKVKNYVSILPYKYYQSNCFRQGQKRFGEQNAGLRLGRTQHQQRLYARILL